MNTLKALLLPALFATSVLAANAQTANPTVTFYSTTDKTDVTLSPADEKTEPAPLDITCTANVDLQGTAYTNYTCEWRIYYSDQGEQSTFLTRYDENITYTLSQAGGFGIKLYITFRNASGDEIEYECEPFKVVISESKLTCPDGFSPNNDSINDKYNILMESIVELEGYIFNRWGKKLHTFTMQNVAEGWDGMVGGKPVPDGVYFLNLTARGSEGVEYKIKKAINVLKGYTNTSETTTP